MDASLHAATTCRLSCLPYRQRPLVEPDVRFSRIRLSDDLSASRHSQGVDGLLMQVDQPLRAQRRIQRRPIQVLTAPVAPRLHESTEPVVDKPVDVLERNPRVPKLKVLAPARQESVHPLDDLLQRRLHLPQRQRPQPFPRPVHGLGRGNHVQVYAGAKHAAVVAEGKAQKVKASSGLVQIDDACLVSIQRRPRDPRVSPTKSVIREFMRRTRITQSSA